MTEEQVQELREEILGDIKKPVISWVNNNVHDYIYVNLSSLSD